MSGGVISTAQERSASRWMLWVLLIFSPWFAWKEILSGKPYKDYMFWLLIVLSAFLGTLSAVINPVCTGSRPFYQIAIVAPVMAVLMVFIIFFAIVVLGATAKWLGAWHGGKGTYQQMQAVLIWSGVPYLLAFLCWFAGILILGQPMLDLYVHDAGAHVFGFMMLLWLAFLVALGYAEAHQFSIGKGLLISGLTYVVPFLLLYTLY